MSQLLIQQYLNQLSSLRKVSGTHRESVVREAFKDLLKALGRSHELTFIPEYELETRDGARRYVDGALLHALRVPFGYWEAKDAKDNLDAEIEYKFQRGYPKSNIIFDDSIHAVLIQHGREVMRCEVENVLDLERLLKQFFAYERPEIEAFRKAIEQFQTDLPAVLDALRSMIERAHQRERPFQEASRAFLVHAREAINPQLVDADVREMLIQHILTGEVFAAVFPGQTFHEDNNIARELKKLEATFFIGNTRYQTLKGLEPYYGAIRRAASQIATHHEKQTFLKAIYENFYKVYNPKAADRLGVVYTPNEIVRFMIESTDWLCDQHFGRRLIDKDVDILDPATGTGTFVCELIEHFAGQPKQLLRKYQSEIHANEVAILPYYVANLNIEATYAAAVGNYLEFPGLCFVDTLDNTHALRKHKGHIDDMFGAVTDDNIQRIRQQNSRTISIIIGNPPYNANQLNENENNKNREYPEIDKRIKETYIGESTAQKTKLYDMYARFFRWATDRLDENGILCFVSNRSFVESRTFDGFRKVVTEEFSEIRIVDLGGDVRSNPKLSGTTHNVFGIQTGVAISFMVKKAKQRGCRILYTRRPEFEKAEEKLAFLANTNIEDCEFTEVRPDKRQNWLNVEVSDFDTFLPIASKATKAAVSSSKERAIFKLFSLGMSTNRDAWLYAESVEVLRDKVLKLIQEYKKHPRNDTVFSDRIKWSETLKRRARAGVEEPYSIARFRTAMYRPFVSRILYQSELFIDRPGALSDMFPSGSASDRCIVVTDPTAQKPWLACASNRPVDLHFVGGGAGAICFPLMRHRDGAAEDNVTDWALEKFKKRYRDLPGGKGRPITKEAIFHYVYGVLHNPSYRERYAVQLKREYPRIPLYGEFWRWAEWGASLMEMHIGYESAEPYALNRVDITGDQSLSPKPLLLADKEEGRIRVDSQTDLLGIPSEVWEYRLGSRSAVEWVLDQYKESPSTDPNIRKSFDSYLFADHKHRVIELIQRVVTVSLRTLEIMESMAAEIASRHV